ncbi:MAG: glycosyltransferase [Candidatus Eisenbacteria bacterium]
MTFLSPTDQGLGGSTSPSTPAPERSSSASESDRRPGVLFLIPTLEAGGAERVCLHYVNGLTRFRPVLAVQFRRGALLEELCPGIPLEELCPRIRLHEIQRPAPIAAADERNYRRRRGPLRRRLATFVERRLGEGTTRFLQERERRWNALVRRARTALRPPVFNPGGRRRRFGGLPRLHLPFHFLFLLGQARRVAALARETECPIVSGFLPFTNGIALFAKVFFHRRLKVVVNVHSVKSRILEGEPPRERFLIGFLIRRFYPKADRVVAVSEGIRRDLVESFGVPESKILVVHNPIDLDRIRRLSLEPVDHPWVSTPEKPLVVAAGRLVRLKGFDLLLRAFAGLRKSAGARLWIVGDGEERENLEGLVRELRLEERVALLGFRKNPWKYMRLADCLVLSSRVEGSPNVIGEALALGLPVIAADCSPGIGEYLGEGRYGVLVPPEDAPALASGLDDLLADGDLRSRLAAGGAEQAERFALPRAVATYETLLEEVVRE